ncbi:MAG: HD domain-containing protein [Clostridium sp.]|nr:HD domain-containing protein [Clostridium sp.]
MEITLPKGVSHIIKTLNLHGFEAYLVGGSIRDLLIDLVPKDYDIATSATPEEVMNIFDKTLSVGIKHGSIMVFSKGEYYDVTTYRYDGEYEQHRYPKNVIFIDDLVEDLRRRDITINAMAYHPEKGIIDPFQGTDDLSSRLIRAVGNPVERFKEDALRILRAIRLATSLNFNIENKTLLAMVETMDGLKFISFERIREEFNGILLAKYPSRGISLLFQLGIMKFIAPKLMPTALFLQFNPHHDEDVLAHTLHVLDNTPSKLSLRLAALFHDTGKPYTYHMDERGIGHFYGHEEVSLSLMEESLTILRYDYKTIDTVGRLISKHMVSLNMKNEAKLKKLILTVGVENLEDLRLLQHADYASKPNKDEKRIIALDQFYQHLYHIIERGDPMTVKDLAIDGRDVLNLGLKQGQEIGRILNLLLDIVLHDPSKNEKKILLNYALKEIKTHD